MSPVNIPTYGIKGISYYPVLTQAEDFGLNILS
jgi:hypothetical protein